MDKPLDRSGLYSVAEKDEQYHRLWVDNSLQEIFQRCLGVRRWVQFRSSLSVLSRFGYFAINTIFDTQTLGEEYCGAWFNGCSIMQRFFMILLNNDLKLPNDIPRPFVDMVRDVHLITFYLFGDFYEFSKRATGACYVGSDQFMGASPSWKQEALNKLIGVISIIKLILNFQKDIEFQQIESKSSCQGTITTGLHSGANSDVLCHLCSNPRKEPTSTICGHVFCWSCIHTWLKDRSECPICRMPTEPSRLIHLVNFR